MKKVLKKIIAYIIAAILLPCVPVFANSVQSVVWTVDTNLVCLSNTPDGSLPSIDKTKTNNVKVTFEGDTVEEATLIVVPVTNGIAEKPTPENAVMILQKTVTDGVVEFDFPLTQLESYGTYAVHISGTDTEYVTKYFYVPDRLIEWRADGNIKRLSNTSNGSLDIINLAMINDLRVTFINEGIDNATITVVPVIDGKAELPIPDNVVLVKQEKVLDGVAQFNFRLSPATEDGVYAIYIGAANNGYTTGYFKVNNKIAPGIAHGQIFQYEDYKSSIDLKLNVDVDTDFEEWAKENMRVKLSSDGTTITVEPEYVSFDINEKVMSINSLGCGDIIPTLGSSMDDNIKEVEISIASPGYWVGAELDGTITEKFKMVTPEFSAEGFKQGMDFEIELYSDNALSEANAIIALYDDKTLVDAVYKENINIAEGTTETIKVTMKNDSLKESGKFSVKVMLWKGFTTEPITSFVLFP